MGVEKLRFEEQYRADEGTDEGTLMSFGHVGRSVCLS